MAPVTATVLRVTTGPAAGCTIGLDADLTIGREGRPGGVSLADDEEMSRRHARFRVLPNGAVLVEDLGSSNGTTVNGQPIEIPRLLALGDEIRVGATTMRLERSVDDFAVLTPSPERDGAGGSRLPGSSLPTLPPPPVPSPPSPEPAHRRRAGASPTSGWRWAPMSLAVCVVVAAVAFGVGRLVGQHAGRREGEGGVGTVYLESGSSQPDSNAIIAYRYRAGGDLQPVDIQEFPTGGAGGFDLTNTGALDADGQIVTSADGKLLFAVNQGSDTVAVFHVLPGGALSMVAGSPFPSGGAAPGGLGISGKRLIVVNKAEDGVRDLRSVSPNVSSFLVRSDGSLRPTGSVITTPPGSSPTEALVTPDGRVVVVPEEHGGLLSLTLGPDGSLRPAPGSPFFLPDAIFPAGFPATERWALGLGAQPTGNLFYGEAVDSAQLVVYRYDDSGRLAFVRAVENPGAFLPCWSLLNGAGTRLYTDNAGNNTMSVFDLSDPSNPHQLQVVTLKNAGDPWDLRMDPSGRFIFVLDPRDRQDLVLSGGGNELHTLLVNANGTLTEPSSSPVPIPVPLNTNPIGLAVVRG